MRKEWGTGKTTVSHCLFPITRFPLNQINDPDGSEIRLGGVGVVFGYGSDVIAGDRDCHFCSKLLVDMIDADFAKFIASL